MLQGRAACLALVGDDEDAGVTCPAVIWLDIKIRVTTRTWPCPIEYTVHEEALGQHEKALEIRTRVFGSEHPDVAISYKNIGIVYHHQGNVGEATAKYTKAYRIFHKVLGPDHPESLGLKPFVKVD